MPYQASKALRYKIPKVRYQVKNWREYDQALQQRGSLTMWVTPEAVAAWSPPPYGPETRMCSGWPSGNICNVDVTCDSF
jgi:hypothetical protein